jgi:hypothetical protein
VPISRRVELYFHFSIRLHEPITVATRSKAWIVFSLSNAGIMGSNPTQGMDVCIVCVYSVFVFCVYVEALRRADPPSMESYRLYILYIGSRSWKRGQGPTKDCRAIVTVIVKYVFKGKWLITHTNFTFTADSVRVCIFFIGCMKKRQCGRRSVSCVWKLRAVSVFSCDK